MDVIATPIGLRALPDQAPPRDRLETAHDQRRPPRLVARADAAAIVAVEVFAEQHQILEVRILGIATLAAVTRAGTVRARQEQAREALRELARHLFEVHEVARACGTLDPQRVTIEVVIAFQRLDQEIVEREPDRPTPVGVATEQAAVR